MQKEYLSTGELAKFLGVHPVTIRRWVKESKLYPIRTPKGRFLFKIDEILKLGDEVKNDKIVGYICVSSGRQKEELERQKELIRYKYQNAQIIQDIGSRLSESEERRGFDELVEMVINKEIGKVVVLRRDILTRFEFKIIKKFFNSYKVDIEILR